MKKKIISLLVCMAIIITMLPMSVSAAGTTGKWHKDKNGWWYDLTGASAKAFKKEYGVSYYEFGFYQIDGKTFFFDENGYALCNGYVGNVYYDRNGYKTSYHGRWKCNNKGWWYEDSTGWYPRNCKMTINGKTYEFDKKGYVVMSSLYKGEIKTRTVYVCRGSSSGSSGGYGAFIGNWSENDGTNRNYSNSFTYRETLIFVKK